MDAADSQSHQKPRRGWYYSGAVKKLAEFMGYNLQEEVIDTIVGKSMFQSMKDNPTTDPNKVEAPTPIFKPGEHHFYARE